MKGYDASLIIVPVENTLFDATSIRVGYKKIKNNLLAVFLEETEV